jgi:chromosome segregation ATPase
LEAVRAYGLWSASLATETRKTLKEERSRYLSSVTKLRSSLSRAEVDIRVKTDAINTLNESFETTKDELKASKSKCSELESKLKLLQISDKEKDKRLEGNARELERKDKQIYALERSSLEEHNHGFSRAVEQLEILHPGLDASGANPRFIVREGQVVDPKARSTFGVVTDHRNT